jgi:thiol-disulfide isomerase/thioredoxin
MSNLNTEQKFICPNCNYETQVAGRRYYEIEWNFHIETRKCKRCNRLFDNIVTKTVTDDKISAISKEFYEKNEPKQDVTEEIDEYASLLFNVKGVDKKNVKCRWCGSVKNEVWKKENPICPKCGEKMKISENKQFSTVSAGEFSTFKDVINSSPKVITYLTEPTCGICRHLQLIIAEIEREFPNEFRFVEFDYEYAEVNKLTSKYKLRFFPTLLTFKNGKYVGQFSNYDSKPDLLKKLGNRFEKN